MSDADTKMLEMLICPLAKEVLSYDKDAQELVSKKAGLAYPIHDGIPIMLLEQARKIEDQRYL